MLIYVFSISLASSPGIFLVFFSLFPHGDITCCKIAVMSVLFLIAKIAQSYRRDFNFQSAGGAAVKV